MLAAGLIGCRTGGAGRAPEERRPQAVRVVIVGASLAAATFVGACGGGARQGPPSTPIVQWHSLGSWSGRGNAQTASFPSVTGSMRVQWQTGHSSPDRPGKFRLTVHSAVSGRPLLVAVDHQGAGHDLAFLHEAPRTFYGVVESSDLDWSFIVEEAVEFDRAP